METFKYKKATINVIKKGDYYDCKVTPKDGVPFLITKGGADAESVADWVYDAFFGTESTKL